MTDPRDPEAKALPIQPARSIILEVARKHGLSADDICGRSQAWRVSRPRHEAMHIIRHQLTGMSLTAIGRAFGGRDHKTVLEGIRSHETRTAGSQDGR